VKEILPARLKMRHRGIGMDFSGAMDAPGKIRLHACIFVGPVFLDGSLETSYHLKCTRWRMFRGDREECDFSDSREKTSVLRGQK
jgi:hypothetical protein